MPLTGGLVEQNWTWGPPGSKPSTLNVLDDGTNQTYDFVDRFWYPHGAGIAQLDFSYTRWGEKITDRPIYGILQPPMLQPNAAGAYEGTAQYFPSLAGQGKFTFFSDLRCEHPEPGS